MSALDPSAPGLPLAGGGGGGGAPSVASTDITDSTSTGRAVLTAASQAAARAAIGAPITTQGDLAVGDATGAPVRLAIGGAGKVLTSNGTTATWEVGSPITITIADISDRGTAGASVLAAATAAAARAAIGAATSDPAAARRWPATADTLLLWEMDGTSGDLTNTGSLGAAGDLTPDAGMVRNARSVASTVGGRGVRVDTSSTSKADGAIGCKPTSGAAWTLWAVFVIVTSDAAKRTIVAADAGPTWTAPWVAAMLTLHNGQLKGEFNDGASYVAFSASMGGTNALRFACLSYDGATARLYLDGAEVATSSRPGATAWSGSAPWHIGANGAGSERFGGYVLRAGLEDVVLSADEIAERWHRLRGDWIG